MNTWRYVSLNIYPLVEGKYESVAFDTNGAKSILSSDGSYGLYLDNTLLEGSSARCPTFDNEPLCSLGEKKGRAVSFECVGLEVWGLGP
jgi:hypothetical protein